MSFLSTKLAIIITFLHSEVFSPNVGRIFFSSFFFSEIENFTRCFDFFYSNVHSLTVFNSTMVFETISWTLQVTFGS